MGLFHGFFPLEGIFKVYYAATTIFLKYLKTRLSERPYSSAVERYLGNFKSGLKAWTKSIEVKAPSSNLGRGCKEIDES